MEDSRFYLIVTPGFEDVLRREVQSWLPDVSFVDGESERGGMTIQTSLENGVELNRVLKTPSRILLRLDEFGCRDFQKLFRKISTFAWQNWLGGDLSVEFQVSSQASRMRMKKRIEETCLDAYAAHLKKRGREPKVKDVPDITVFVRVKDDTCTLSLDTSGELLHKRGLKPLVSDAPLRETLAASLLFSLEMAGDSPTLQNEEIELIDPMTGGGTFLLEAGFLRKPIASRKFAFEQMKPWRTGKKASAILKTPEGARFVSLVGYDRDEKALAAARENLRGVEGAVDLRSADFLKAAPLPACLPGRRRWLVVNPPYGERIQVKGRLADFYSELVRAAKTIADPDRACFLFPTKVAFEKIKWPMDWQILARRKFLNGGLHVEACIVSKMSK